MKQISEQDKKEIRRAALGAVAQCLLVGQLTTVVGKIGKPFYDPQETVDWKNVFERVEEMNGYVAAAFNHLKCARREMQFLTNKQLELDEPRKVGK